MKPSPWAREAKEAALADNDVVVAAADLVAATEEVLEDSTKLLKSKTTQLGCF